VAEKHSLRIVVGDGPPPGSLGGSLKGYVPPGAQYDYRPPSVFARYRTLSIVFAALILLLVIYSLLAPREDSRLNRVPASPAAKEGVPDAVYVLPIPEKH
jgi:hypothetical protein